MALITRNSFRRSPLTSQERLDSACWNVCHFTTPRMLQRKGVCPLPDLCLQGPSCVQITSVCLNRWKTRGRRLYPLSRLWSGETPGPKLQFSKSKWGPRIPGFDLSLPATFVTDPMIFKLFFPMHWGKTWRPSKTSLIKGWRNSHFM